MKSLVAEAKRRHREGYNCAQAVACTYSSLLGMDEKTAFRVMAAFGLGIAKRAETCGSVCAMMMLAGLKDSDGNLQKSATKLSTFDLGAVMAKKFEEWNTSCTCAVLRGNAATGRIRTCRGCVADSARIVEDFLFPGQFDAYEPRKKDEE